VTIDRRGDDDAWHDQSRKQANDRTGMTHGGEVCAENYCSACALMSAPDRI
jgi:hypothetical protein